MNLEVSMPGLAGVKTEHGLEKERSFILVISSITSGCPIWLNKSNRDTTASVHDNREDLSLKNERSYGI